VKRRDVLTKMRTTLKEFFLKSRKEHLTNEINNLLRNKFIDEIDVSASLVFFSARRRLIVDVDREETNIVDAERDKHQIEQHRAQYCENHHHSDLLRCRDENERATRNRRDDDDDYNVV
jgi:ABC-type transport system involved in cytochrome bd biosynthesis fused ATPase/permease subunit